MFVQVLNSQVFLKVNACYKTLQFYFRSRVYLAGKIPVERCVMTWVTFANPVFNIQFSTFEFFHPFSFHSVVTCDYYLLNTQSSRSIIINQCVQTDASEQGGGFVHKKNPYIRRLRVFNI